MSTVKQKAIRELLKLNIKTKNNLMVAKRKIAKKYGIGIPENSEILKYVRTHQGAFPSVFLRKILRKRAVRTLSGIAPVAVLVKSFTCPGKCVYCPTEKGVPQSYLSNEPAVMRAIRCGYDPYRQVQLRLRALEANGHEPTKIEIIVIGGTWSVLPEKYKYWYIKECFRGANNYQKLKNTHVILEGAKRPIESQRDPIAPFSRSRMTVLKRELLKEQKKNEKVKYKIIGLTLETRPDYINEKELMQMRELGCTRVELGVQAIDDKILKKNKRGHGVKEIADATKMLRDFGFKITYHFMPGLPGSSPKKDLKMFELLFSNERFQPDQIKFYPTVVTKGSLLYNWWKTGKYRPYTDKVLQKLIVECKKAVPEYVRIIRLIRDIPGESIMAGNKITNLRQVMQGKGVKCRCIRCREARSVQLSINNYQLTIKDYKASGGMEYFIQAESKDKKTLYGFCRLSLREPHYEWGTSEFIPFSKKERVALIRELHVYGELVSVPSAGSEQVAKKIQHEGLGKKLMREAEKIAKENGYKKIAVISGIGAREYYRKLEYRQRDSYMVKSL